MIKMKKQKYKNQIKKKQTILTNYNKKLNQKSMKKVIVHKKKRDAIILWINKHIFIEETYIFLNKYKIIITNMALSD